MLQTRAGINCSRDPPPFLPDILGVANFHIPSIPRAFQLPMVSMNISSMSDEASSLPIREPSLTRSKKKKLHGRRPDYRIAPATAETSSLKLSNN